MFDVCATYYRKYVVFSNRSNFTFHTLIILTVDTAAE